VALLAETAQEKLALEKAVMADAKVQQMLEGKTIKHTIIVPGKLVSIVIE
jgi:leucyl-tRNA synthetase